MELDYKPIISTLVYSVLGMGIFGLGFGVLKWLTPFSIRKEIEEDQNVALAVIIGAVFVSLAIIIAAAIT